MLAHEESGPPVSVCSQYTPSSWCSAPPVYTPSSAPTPIPTPLTPPPWSDPNYLYDLEADCNYENAYARDYCESATGQNVILPEAGLGMNFIPDWKPGDGISDPVDPLTCPATSGPSFETCARARGSRCGSWPTARGCPTRT